MMHEVNINLNDSWDRPHLWAVSCDIGEGLLCCVAHMKAKTQPGMRIQPKGTLRRGTHNKIHED